MGSNWETATIRFVWHRSVLIKLLVVFVSSVCFVTVFDDMMGFSAVTLSVVTANKLKICILKTGTLSSSAMSFITKCVSIFTVRVHCTWLISRIDVVYWKIFRYNLFRTVETALFEFNSNTASSNIRRALLSFPIWDITLFLNKYYVWYDVEI